MGAFFVSSLSITWRKKLRSFQNCSVRMRHNRIAALSRWCGQVKRGTLPLEDFLKSFARPNTDFVAVFQKIPHITYEKKHNPFTRIPA